jgi:antitoxin HicB
MKIAYPAKFEADEAGRVLVTFRDLPEAGTDGADMAEARREAADLLDSTLMFRMKYREDIPSPSKARKGEELVAPDMAVAMKIALYIAMRRRGVTAAELSRRLRVDNREVQRILNPRHATKTARMSEAIEAATGGARPVIELASA